MSSNNLLPNLLRMWSYSLPTMIVLVVGIVAAVARYRRFPQAALLVALGCTVNLLSALLMPVITFTISTNMAGNGPALMMMINLVWTLFHAVGLLLILLGAFADRPSAGGV